MAQWAMAHSAHMQSKEKAQQSMYAADAGLLSYMPALAASRLATARTTSASSCASSGSCTLQ